MLLRFLFHFASAVIATSLGQLTGLTSAEYGSSSSAGLDNGHDGRLCQDHCFTAELMLLLAADRLQHGVGACNCRGLACGSVTQIWILISLQAGEVLEGVAIFPEMGMKVLLLLCAYYLTVYLH